MSRTLALLAVPLVFSSSAQAQCRRVTFQGEDVPPATGFFGHSVAIDGDLVLIGTRGGPVVARLFDASSGEERVQLTVPLPGPAQPPLGNLDLDAPVAVIGEPAGAGAVHVFSVPDGVHRRKLTVPGLPGGSQLGWSTALSGTRLVTGAPSFDGPAGDASGAAFLFDLDAPDAPLGLVPSQSEAGARYGLSVAMEGRWIAVAAPEQNGGEGIVFVFDALTGAEIGRLTASLPQSRGFGWSLAAQGGRLLVGCGHSLETYLFDLPSGAPLAVLQTPVGGAESVALSGDRAVVGIGGFHVWVFDVGSGAIVSELRSDAVEWEAFGRGLDAQGRRVIVGAPWFGWGEEGGGGRAYRIDLCPSLGASYCDPAVPNTKGLSARILAYGSDAVGDGDFHLVAEQMPPERPGLFLASRVQGFVPGAGGSDGNLCLGGHVLRTLGGLEEANWIGTFQEPIDLTKIGGAIAGQTWHFQAWYRDGFAKPWKRSNFTDAISVQFQ